MRSDPILSNHLSLPHVLPPLPANIEAWLTKDSVHKERLSTFVH